MKSNAKKVALHNLGCKVNSYETDAMAKLLEEAGYELMEFEPGADIYIINTCTVTNIADRKSRQMLHKAKKMNPDAVVIAVGCYVQAAGEELKQDEAIDIIVGNNRKHSIVDVINNYFESKEADSIIDIANEKSYEAAFSIEKSNDRMRAFIKIQDGCNQFCSYCIIPYARGRIRSRKMDDMLKEVKALAKNGFKEIVLTGIHLSSYGKDFEEENVTLLDAILECARVEGIERIRLGSLEPGIITREFIEALSKEKKFCPHFHLSLQSGCNETLKRMNRKYTTEEYYEKCCIIREYFPFAAITTDVIVGFPQETEEEFQKTKEFLKKVDFAEMHIFKYSKRNGTVAAKMSQQVDDRIKNERSNQLIELGDKMHKEFVKQFIGKDIEVLIEEKITINNEDYYTGYTKEYVKGVILADGIGDKYNSIVTFMGKQIIVDERTKEEILLAEI
ncbi:MAG: tRNA (N(6)-L-threonylcarbamoyladenosine(37)-C(2))-methylthiotransferase MtaB [Lachnospiraceae bacterium]|nr:tRNA (N(6)-L-threonylcarbamoyladenosine(37)-C(2))-methylthiotransferase MtaB [Lachnospiraceae bacterium]